MEQGQGARPQSLRGPFILQFCSEYLLGARHRDGLGSHHCSIPWWGPAGSEMTTAQVQKDVKRALLGNSEHRTGCMDGQGKQESQGHPLGCLGRPGGNEMDIWEGGGLGE